MLDACTGDQPTGSESREQDYRVVPVCARPRNVVFVVPNSEEFGGLERHLFDLISRLRRPDLRLSIVCFRSHLYTQFLEGDQTSNVSLLQRTEPRSLLGWIRLLRGVQADVIVFCYSWIAAFPWQAPAGAMSLGIRRRFAIQHLMPTTLPPPVQGSGPRNLLRRLIGKRARRLLPWKVSAHLYSRTICVSNAVHESLVAICGIPESKAATVRNGVSTSNFVPSERARSATRGRLGVAPDEFLLICIARLSDAKGLDVLLQALACVLRQGISFKCAILGDGPLKAELLALTRSLGLSGNVFFEGFQQDVRPYLQAGSAFILTSHVEGLPLSVLEAMACGLPCIVTNVGGSAEAVTHQVDGLVVPPGSVEMAADAISFLATHPGEREQMATTARETVCRRFDVERQMEQLIRIILD